jgi:hypothetical protein
LSEKDLEQTIRINLILGIETGDGCQDGFEGTKCFSWPLREFDHSYGTPKSPVDPASLFD